jgi:hypothetical protein
MHLGHTASSTPGTIILGTVLVVLGVATVLRSRYE